MSQIKKLLKPRDQNFLAMRQRKQGVQVVSRKAIRSRDKASLKKGGYE